MGHVDDFRSGENFRKGPSTDVIAIRSVKESVKTSIFRPVFDTIAWLESINCGSYLDEYRVRHLFATFQI